MQFKASAPGSMMLLGEYAVLHGKPSMVCAVDKRITVILTPRDDDKVEIVSRFSHQPDSLFGQYSTTLATLTVEKPFQFVLGVLSHYRAKIKRGCDIEIISEFSDQIGLGSSAAVTVATLSVLTLWLNIRISALDLVRQARIIIHTVQGVGSGADAAASVYGGIVAFQNQPVAAEKFSVVHPLSAVYSGFKTPTVTAIQMVQQKFLNHSNLFRSLCNSIGQCAFEGIQMLRKEEWSKLGMLFNVQQGLMEALGVNTLLLRNLVEDLRNQSSILGAKISGSGLGDCVIGLGELVNDYTFPSSETEVKRIPVEISLQGVQCEKI